MAGSKTGKPLTALAIRVIEPGDKPRLVRDFEVSGLCLRVLPSGAKGFLLRYRFDGRRRDLWLGSTDKTTLATARQEARDAHALIRAGIDPIARRDAARQESDRLASLRQWTFEKAATEVHSTLAPTFKNTKHAAQWLSTLKTYAFPKLGDKPVGEVGVAEVVSVLKPIWNTKAETASRVKQRIDAVMRWAVAHGHATTNPVASATELLGRQLASVKHHEAMAWAEVPSFIKLLKESTDVGQSVKLGLELLILTGCRSGEVRLATWAEVDLNKRIWSIPAARMKAGRLHEVPLSDRAVALLEQAKAAFGAGGYIFPGAKPLQPLSDMAFTMPLRRMKLTATAHGFRSSLRDWCAEHQVSRELAERILAHAVADQTEAAYNRTTLLEQRRAVMQRWAEHVGSSK